MSKTRFFKKRQGLEGQLDLDAGRIKLLFSYSPERVAFIKKIKGYRYNPAEKSWSIPYDAFNEISKSKLFPENSFAYNFENSDLEKTPKEFSQLKDEALTAYKTNLFSLEKKYLPYLNLEVFFFKSRQMPQLRAKIRFASKAASLIAKQPGSGFISSEGSYSVSVAQLTDIIKKLKTKNFSFAVEKEVAEELKRTAELRRQIIDEEYQATTAELLECLLTPFIDYAQDSEGLAFELIAVNSRQLADLFPDLDNFQTRKKQAKCLSKGELFRLYSRAKMLKFPLFLSRSVAAFIKAELKNNSETQHGFLIENSEYPYLWTRIDGLGAGLFCKEARPDLVSSFFESIAIDSNTFYRCLEHELPKVFDEIQPKINGQFNNSFFQYLNQIRARNKAVDINIETRHTADALINPELFSENGIAEKLYPHQRVAVNWLRARNYALLGDDMGLGKTLSILATADSLLKSETIDWFIVVCPNSLTRNWIKEAGNFFPKRRLLILPDVAKDRATLLRQIRSEIVQTSGLVINYEKIRIPEVLEALLEICDGKKTLICCDESQRIKNAKSKSFLALLKLAKKAQYRYALSGTPTPKDITDIWSQVNLLDGGERFGNNFNQWIKKVAELGTKYSDYAVRKFKSGALEETIARTQEILLRRQKEEVLFLPEKTFTERDCKMGSAQLERYKELCEQLLLKISTLNGDAFYKQIDNVLEEYLRAVQIASNPRLIDPNWKGQPCKFEELDEIINEVVIEREQKIVVWTNFLGNLTELGERYKHLGCAEFSGRVSAERRNQIVEEFQKSDRLKILLAIPAAGGVGITLTAAQTAVYLDKSWNAEHWLQSVDRIHRIGQRGCVDIISLSACKVDELIARNLSRKSRMLRTLLSDDEVDSRLSERPSREELIEALRED